MRKSVLLVGILSLLLLAQAAAAQSPVPLPVRKVVLYKNGIGYFEHLGAVKGAQEVEITLPSAQLNDVLKSLTVIDLGRGQVAGVTYDSAAPLDRRLAELPIDLSSAKGLVDFLNQIRGTEVEIRAPGGAVSGRLMGAELRSRSTGPGATTQFVQVSVYSSGGEVKLVELESAGALRIADPHLASDIGRYFELLSSAKQRDVRRLRIHSTGSGDRQLYVSYTSEAPIWKTTYRIVLDPKQKPLLQGWAIVDNTTPMDWDNVELSLVAGAPVSFVQNLSQPLYARRPVVPLPQGFQVTPQTHEATLERGGGPALISGTVVDPTGAVIPGATVTVFDQSGNVVAEESTDERGYYAIELPTGVYRVEISGGGFKTVAYGGVSALAGRSTAVNATLEPGAVMETIEVAGTPLEADEFRRDRAAKAMVGGIGVGYGAGLAGGRIGDVMRGTAPAAARGQALGEQFEYSLRQPVTIRRNQSALLPIIHTEVEGEKVTLYNESSGQVRPWLAVWLKNGSGLTLDAGSFTVIDTNAFAGEGLTETINPGESRLLSYALDLGVEVATNRDTDRERVERVEIVKGLLRLHRKVVERKTYTIRNNDAKTRTVVVEHPVRAGWTLVETAAPTESSSNYHRFKLEAKSKATTELAVREENPQETVYALSNVTPEQITLWVRQKAIDAEIEAALKRILAKKNEIDGFNQQIARLEAEQNEIFRDQQRVRDNLNRLGGTPEEANLRLRYIRQMEQQETRIGSLRAERAKIEDARAAAQKELDAMLESLSFDRKL
ncbi:MAG: carboxypeptidase regulatory-like domain-containing protein [Candidatus Acidiferrales bacterium]